MPDLYDLCDMYELFDLCDLCDPYDLYGLCDLCDRYDLYGHTVAGVGAVISARSRTGWLGWSWTMNMQIPHNTSIRGRLGSELDDLQQIDRS